MTYIVEELQAWDVWKRTRSIKHGVTMQGDIDRTIVVGMPSDCEGEISTST